MKPNTSSALNAYKNSALEADIAAASPHRLILLLFDGALTAISVAKFNMAQGNVAMKGSSISKAIAIVDEGLRLSLDKTAGGELAEQLDSLYEYIAHRLLLANINNVTDYLDECAGLLGQLRDAWDEIGKRVGTPQGAEVPVTDKDKPAASYGKV